MEPPKTTQNHPQNTNTVQYDLKKRFENGLHDVAWLLDVAWQILSDSVDHVCIFLVDMKWFLV